MNKSFILLSFVFCFLQINAAQYNCSGKHTPAHSGKVQAANTTHYLDVLHYALNLDFTARQQKKISGNALLTATSKRSRSEISLDLLALQVDSVFFNGQAKNFRQAGDSLVIELSTTINTSDTFELNIYYQGSPQEDPSGWGGFYFSGNYSFNLGVGFESNPHNFGRAWFPCVDNFTDRSTYDFYIKTDTFSKAVCNGLLVNATVNGDGTATWHWELEQSIPTYLASVAVANYAFVEYEHQGFLGEIPVLLAATAADTSNMNKSFKHLPDAIDAFETFLGPYRWDRVGFVLVPFSSGAMEHATNIAYPRAATNGTLAYETLMAHEFAHHWWGNLITCETAEDMWINEGWASYMPMLFDEYLYGKERYRASFRENHREVLQWAHIRDAGFRAVSGVPHEYTYGDHVYNKGASVAYTMRAYLKENFFPCLSQLMEQKAFQHINSSEFRDFMSDCSAKSLDDFFENWVFNPGYTHISLDSFTVSQTESTFDVEVVLRQKTKYAPALFENIPVEIWIGNANEIESFEVNMQGSCGTFNTSIDFKPEFVLVDPLQKIADATTDYLLEIDSLANYSLTDALAEINISQVGNSTSKLQITKHWIAPDNLQNAAHNLHISTEGYWSVQGHLADDLKASLELIYDGSNSGANANLDTELLSNSEDSLVLLYRKNAGQNWALADSFQIMAGNLNDKKGRVFLSSFKTGEYALAIYDAQKSDTTVQFLTSPCQILTSIEADKFSSPEKKTKDFNVFPNPNKGKFQVDLREFEAGEVEKISVYSLAGKIVWQKLKPSKMEEISSRKWYSAFYMLNVHLKDKTLSKKIFVH